MFCNKVWFFQVDLMAVHSVLIPGQKFSSSQLAVLSELANVGGLSPSLPEARAEALLHIDSMKNRLKLLDCQLSWIRVFFRNSSEQFEDLDVETEHIRLLSLLFQDSFRLEEPNMSEKLDQVACCAYVAVESPGISLELRFAFFEASAKRSTKFSFESCTGMTTGDLSVLHNMLSLPGTNGTFFFG